MTTEEKLGISPVRLRTIEARDLKRLTDILTVSFHSPDGLLYWLYPLLRLGIYEDLRSRLPTVSPHYCCLVATQSMFEFGAEKDEIIGTVEISLHSKFFFGDYVPYVSNLAVNPAHRRQGIGRKLLLKCEQIALDWGFQEISLHVLENNYQAKRLYFSSGYRLCRIEYSVISWLFKRPRRLLLNKRILRPRQQSNFSAHGGKSG